eukprot:m.120893 g.120893  ORF g.120893 m.120893 type:complete len:111 (+) comp14564_c0_seq2:63-395(+)
MRGLCLLLLALLVCGARSQQSSNECSPQNTTIVSPTTVTTNSDQSYSNNQVCVWNIFPQADQCVALNFTRFDIESGYDLFTVSDSVQRYGLSGLNPALRGGWECKCEVYE